MASAGLRDTVAVNGVNGGALGWVDGEHRAEQLIEVGCGGRQLGAELAGARTRPVLAVFAVAALMALGLSWFTYQDVFTLRAFDHRQLDRSRAAISGSSQPTPSLDALGSQL